MPSDADEIRLKDGSGMISPDCFFDNRLMFLPKASTVLLILFNRHHNVVLVHFLFRFYGCITTSLYRYIARRLRLQGETLQDDEIFEIARHVNCGATSEKIIQGDFLRPLVGLSTVGPSGYKSNILFNTGKARFVECFRYESNQSLT